MEQQASNKEKGIEFRYNQCKQKCHYYKTKRTDQECLDKCYEKYVSKLYPQISEKLLAIVFPKVNDKGIIKYLSYNGI
ncbi:hypothetical protein [Wolbachia endosymbiont of Tetranychus urticae]|uniref:hypothetical protein n=1 Tax=Wolbachia endosymbiont of Tetranychus urticae TaxID=169184 RepID=UPI003979DA1C